MQMRRCVAVRDASFWWSRGFGRDAVKEGLSGTPHLSLAATNLRDLIKGQGRGERGRRLWCFPNTKGSREPAGFPQPRILVLFPESRCIAMTLMMLGALVVAGGSGGRIVAPVHDVCRRSLG